MTDKIQSLGEYRVGLSFNPSGNIMVDKIKSKAAELIDLIETLKIRHEGGETCEREQEASRLAVIAQDQIESAAMFAVKAATKQA